MRNAAQHCELGRLIQLERLAHPREEMRQAVMTTLHSLRNACTAARERKCAYAVRAQANIRVDG